MYWKKTPWWIQWWFNDRIWQIPGQPRTLYLTFDDGPTPQVTSSVLRCLTDFDVRATFFCVGQQVEQYPVLYKKIIREGHAIGNHTYLHSNGWKTPFAEYKSDIERGFSCTQSRLFRPPYGKLTPSQSRWLRRNDHKMVLWDVMPGDFDERLTGKDCLQNAIQATSDGSIIVLHDTAQAWERLQYLLPRYIEHFLKKGYRFERLDAVV